MTIATYLILQQLLPLHLLLLLSSVLFSLYFIIDVKLFQEAFVAFWVTNPCRITRKVKQTKMYVCTFEEFILVDIWIHCCASWK